MIVFRCKFIFVVMLLMSANALALPVTMTANDPIATASFNTAGTWSDGLAPSAGNTYSTVGWLLRTPIVYGNYTFAGSSLTVGGGTAGGKQPFLTNGSLNNNSFICKTPIAGDGTAPVITVNNLILDASYIRDGMGSADAWTLAGNIFVTGNGGGLANHCTLNIESAINGSGTLYIADNGSGDASRVTIIKSGLNTYNGSINLLGSSNARCRLTFADDSLMNFTIKASGVNNSISGTGTATFNGDFYFNLTDASKTLGDSWVIASATSQTFSDTFAVLGFNDIGGNLWLKTIDATHAYQFSEGTGKLTIVPEPATITLLGLGGLALLRKRRA
jgi:hypothetical protein